MPFDSNEKSPCIGCNLQYQSKVTREKQGSCVYKLRTECQDCKPLDNYKNKSRQLYAHFDVKTVHEINDRAIQEIGMSVNQ